MESIKSNGKRTDQTLLISKEGMVRIPIYRYTPEQSLTHFLENNGFDLSTVKWSYEGHYHTIIVPEHFIVCKNKGDHILVLGPEKQQVFLEYQVKKGNFFCIPYKQDTFSYGQFSTAEKYWAARGEVAQAAPVPEFEAVDEEPFEQNAGGPQRSF